MAFRIPKVIAVDLDGTLLVGTECNAELVAWLREQKADGYSIMLWSMRGAEVCRNFAKAFQLSDLFDTICAKPGLVVDDKGWAWTKDTRIVRRFNREEI